MLFKPPSEIHPQPGSEYAELTSSHLTPTVFLPRSVNSCLGGSFGFILMNNEHPSLFASDPDSAFDVPR